MIAVTSVETAVEAAIVAFSLSVGRAVIGARARVEQSRERLPWPPSKALRARL